MEQFVSNLYHAFSQCILYSWDRQTLWLRNCEHCSRILSDAKLPIVNFANADCEVRIPVNRGRIVPNLHRSWNVSYSQMDGTTSQFSTANGHRNRSEISPMHAAAVNGDKSSLSKLLTSMYHHCHAFYFLCHFLPYLCAVFAARPKLLNASQRSRVGVGMNVLSGVKCKAFWAVPLWVPRYIRTFLISKVTFSPLCHTLSPSFALPSFFSSHLSLREWSKCSISLSFFQRVTRMQYKFVFHLSASDLNAV